MLAPERAEGTGPAGSTSVQRPPVQRNIAFVRLVPVTPPNSIIWRIVHFPLVLLLIGIAFMVGAGITTTLVSRAIPHANNDWLAVGVAVIVAAIFVAFYCAFARLVERRPAVEEFALNGWAKELGAGLLGGFLLFSVVVGEEQEIGRAHV